jgi:hypothetical protein
MSKGKKSSSGVPQQRMMEHIEDQAVEKSSPSQEAAKRDFTKSHKPAGSINKTGPRKQNKSSKSK